MTFPTPRLDNDVKRFSKEALQAVTRATELFMESLVEGALPFMKAKKRRTIQHADMHAHQKQDRRKFFLSGAIRQNSHAR